MSFHTSAKRFNFLLRRKLRILHCSTRTRSHNGYRMWISVARFLQFFCNMYFLTRISPQSHERTGPQFHSTGRFTPHNFCQNCHMQPAYNLSCTVCIKHTPVVSCVQASCVLHLHNTTQVVSRLHATKTKDRRFSSCSQKF